MSSGSDSAGTVGIDSAEEFARDHPGIVKFARVGWVAKGLVYALTGFLAFLIAFGSSRGEGSGTGDGAGEASQSGAVASIAGYTGGAVLLVVVAVGLVIYALWCLVCVMLPADNDLAGWASRVGFLVSAIVSLFLAFTATAFALRDSSTSSSSGSQDQKVQSFTRDFMAHSGGRVLVALIGLVLLAIAIGFCWKAFSSDFESRLKGGPVGPVSHDLLVQLGRIGWVGRASMMGLIGYFLVRAAILFDPEAAQGLDGSLRKTASSGVGTVLVLLVAVGMFVYGVFCVLSAPKRRLAGADR